MSNKSNKNTQYATMDSNPSMAKLVSQYTNVNVGNTAIPKINGNEYIASLSSNFN